MIEEIAACLPDSLSAYGRAVAAGPGGPDARPVAALRDRAVFDDVLDAFGAGVAPPGQAIDRRALASYWSQYYLAALVTPALTAWLRLGRGLPLALDDLGFELDAACRPCRFLLPDTPCAGPEPCLATLVEGHLRPLCALCHAHAGLAPRVFWTNAGVIADYVAGELRTGTSGAARQEVASLLGQGAADGAVSPLADTLRVTAADGGKRRRVCCLRYRLPGVPSCGVLCPVDCRKNGSC